jgi:hypothetical protein
MEVWGDESGNLDFDPTSGSKFFIVCTIAVADPALANDLLTLRRQLECQGFDLHEGFHATEDRQPVRDAVFSLLAARRIRADVSVFRKNRVYQRIRDDHDYFYKWVWFYHMKFTLPKVVPDRDVPFIVISTIGTKKKRRLYTESMRDVVRQCLHRTQHHCAYWSAASHPCLQAADYYTWAVARWLEGGDQRSYNLVRHQVRSLWRFP